MPKNIAPRLIPDAPRRGFSGSQRFRLCPVGGKAPAARQRLRRFGCSGRERQHDLLQPAGMTQVAGREFSAGANIITTSFEVPNSGSRVGFLSWRVTAAMAAAGTSVPNGLSVLAGRAGLVCRSRHRRPYGNDRIRQARGRFRQSDSFEIKTITTSTRPVAWRANEWHVAGRGCQLARAMTANHNGRCGYWQATPAPDGSRIAASRGIRRRRRAGTGISARFTIAAANQDRRISYRDQDDRANDRGQHQRGPARAQAMGCRGKFRRQTEVKTARPFHTECIAQVEGDQWKFWVMFRGWLEQHPGTGHHRLPRLPRPDVDRAMETKFDDTLAFRARRQLQMSDAWVPRWSSPMTTARSRTLNTGGTSLLDNDRTWLTAGVHGSRPRPRRLVGALHLGCRDARSTIQAGLVQSPGPQGNYDDYSPAHRRPVLDGFRSSVRQLSVQAPASQGLFSSIFHLATCVDRKPPLHYNSNVRLTRASRA